MQALEIKEHKQFRVGAFSDIVLRDVDLKNPVWVMELKGQMKDRNQRER
jgi:hypothetical protein